MLRVSPRLAAAGILVACLFAVPARAQSPSALPAQVRVVRDTQILRWFPHTPDEVIGSAEADTTLDVIGREHDWYWVITPRDANGSRRGGWVAAGDVEPYVAPPPAYASATAPVAAAPPVEAPAPRRPQPEAARAPAAPAPAPAPERKPAQFDDVLFDLDRSSIRPDAIANLDRVTAAMDEDPALRLRLEGNTCDLGTTAHNQALGQRRAAAVRDYLMGHGVAASRLSVVSYGETRPKYENTDDATRRLNRRVAIVPQQ